MRISEFLNGLPDDRDEGAHRVLLRQPGDWAQTLQTVFVKVEGLRFRMWNNDV
jgi:hypothetical protein